MDKDSLSYQELLKDPRWQKKRLQIMERDNWSCQSCYDDESTLVVHHRLYLFNKAPWDYPDELLVTLCESCHNKEKNQRPIIERLFIDALRKRFLSDDILELYNGLSKLTLLHASEVVASAYADSFRSPDIQRSLLDRLFSDVNTRAASRAAREAGAIRPG